MSDDRIRVHEALVALGVAQFVTSLGLDGRRRGPSKWAVPCPVHNGTDRNCEITVKDGAIVFVCRSGCAGAGGDALALVAAVHGLDVRSQFGEVLRHAAQIAGITLDGPRAASPYSAPRAPKPVDPALDAHARELAEGRGRVLSALAELCPLEGEGERYLAEQRGLDPAICRAHGVGFVADPERVMRVLTRGFSTDVLDELGIIYRGEWFAFARHPLLFFVAERGAPVFVQGRTLHPVAQSHERWRSMRGSVPCLWGVDSLADRPSRRVVLAEGPIDALTAVQWSKGRHAVTGILGAGGLKPEWCKTLRGRSVTLALDPDAAGERGCERATEMLHAVGADVRRMTIPDGLDLNAWYCAEHAA